jgi:hypothetical protein
MAMHSSLLSDRQRQLVSKNMIYTEEPAGLLATSKIMQYKSPDYGSQFSGESGNNVIKFTVNGPGLLDPRSLYLQYSMQNKTVRTGAASSEPTAASGVPLINCDPGSYSPFKRVRILSGFNQQVLYDCDGYNVMCAFLDDYLKSVHDLIVEDQGFYALADKPIEFPDLKSPLIIREINTAAGGDGGGGTHSVDKIQSGKGYRNAPNAFVCNVATTGSAIVPIGTYVSSISFNAVVTAGQPGFYQYYLSQSLPAVPTNSQLFALVPRDGSFQSLVTVAPSLDGNNRAYTLEVSSRDVKIGMLAYGVNLFYTDDQNQSCRVTNVTLNADGSTCVVELKAYTGAGVLNAVPQGITGAIPVGSVITFTSFQSIEGIMSGGEPSSYNMIQADASGARAPLGCVGGEYFSWQFKPQLSGVGYSSSGLTQGLLGQNGSGGSIVSDNAWPANCKLFTLTDLPYIGLFSQGKYLPLWGMGGIILELYLDSSSNWCCPSDVSWSNLPGTVDAGPIGGSTPVVQLADCKLFYDNVVPPADFLESMKNQINSEDGLSLVFPSVNRHLATLNGYNWASGSAVSYSSTLRTEILVADHSRMAQTIFQIYRPQELISSPYRPYKLHNRTSAALAAWQLKLNSAYIPQQPLLAVGGNQSASGVKSCDGSDIVNQVVSGQNYALLNVRQYGQFHKELLKALGQQKRPIGSVTPSQYELLTDTAQNGTADATALCVQSKNFMKYGCRGAFAVGVDLTVSDDVMTGTNLRNATVTGEMYCNIDQFLHPGATKTEVNTYVMKLSQIRMTSAGPIIVD